jgi:hypothetical protein
MKKDRLNPARTDRDVRAILELVVEVRAVWEQAVDGGTWPPGSGFNGPGSGLVYQRPTEAAVSSPTRTQLRAAAREASDLLGEARSSLEEAATVLARAFLLSDPEVHREFLEKRAAATQNGAGRRTTPV